MELAMLVNWIRQSDDERVNMCLLLMFVVDVSTTTVSDYDASGSGMDDTSDSTY